MIASLLAQTDSWSAPTIDWHAIAPELVLIVGINIVLASDLLYEARNVELLLDLLPRLVDETGLVLIADPGRVPAGRFIAAAPEQGWTVRSVPSPRAKRVLIHRLRRDSPQRQL